MRSFAISGNFSGSGRSQSMQRNFRPPVLTSINRIGLLHFEHVGGGRFLGMAAHAGQAGALPNSLSPITAEDGPVMLKALRSGMILVGPVSDSHSK